MIVLQRATSAGWRSVPSISTRSRGLRATSALHSYNTRLLQAGDPQGLVENVTDAVASATPRYASFDSAPKRSAS